MENIIEKLKAVDKKVWIGVGIGAAVLIIAGVALAIGGKDKPAGGDTQNTQPGTQTESSSEIFGTEDVTEVLGTEETTETEMGTETEMSESESQLQGGTTSNVVVTQPESVDGVEQKPVTTTPDGQEILGLGSASQPYEVIPDLATMTLTTVEVPAGKTLYYSVQRIGGMYLNINDPDLYIIDASGRRHDSSYTVESAMANENVTLQIGNKGTSNKIFTIRFTNLSGTYQNPQVITSLSGSKDLAKGDQVGWYYRYTTTQAGKVRFYINSTADSDITVTNLNTSAVRNFESDDKGGYIEVEVSAGDVLMIQICVKPDKRWNYPATHIDWRGEYAQ